ncbi:MAG: divergent polysaccharide deacetylase family protein [Acidobacteria bacterium]|nr:divergent polysaccharide deacetylase family protein [Acidobacteriota bacterium]MBS1864714.1 divergent polysaccharide deacetylase family protein [Acidobacteriota bacterium]
MKLQATSKEPGLPDWLEITLFTEANAAESSAQATQILNGLSGVAERHKLQSGSRFSKEGSFSASFHSGSRTTHFVEIKFVRALNVEEKTVSERDLPRLAIILDDLGSDRAAAESIFAMGYPLTISILPNHEHSREIADEALQRGYQVMLHLPMQSVANESPEKKELRPGMSREGVEKFLDEMVVSVPNAVGVNNHQGSQATSDPVLMENLMPALRDLNLFYVDSRTTAATVAFDTAKKEGVATAFRNVPFLDDVQDVAAIRKQLRLALRGAKEKKSAIAIGHPHPATLEAMREFLPSVQENGVRLVFVSELVH